jgi:hypothetical protein
MLRTLGALSPTTALDPRRTKSPQAVSSQAATSGPSSSSRCSLKRSPGAARRSRLASVALRHAACPHHRARSDRRHRGTRPHRAADTLVNFNWSNGAFPFAGINIDANGDLFGATTPGGFAFHTMVRPPSWGVSEGPYSPRASTMPQASGGRGAIDDHPLSRGVGFNWVPSQNAMRQYECAHGMGCLA